MAHVFIVDEKTFSIHLKYRFAGTGAKDYKCDFLKDNASEVKPTIERLLSGMIADISRVKKNDDVIFYLQQTAMHEGMFFGSFKVAEEPFLCCDNYLEKELGKNLPFRVKLNPNKVFEKGITERECLDSLKGIEHPSQMCWSLIYRKLKANRGCTMITNYEYEQIMKKIELKNNGKFLDSDKFDYLLEANKIISISQKCEYKGKKESLDIKNRLLYKKNKRNAYESHLQAYILQNIFNIECLKINKNLPIWIGNEVSCGVGMQSIDICFIQEDEKEVYISICELKDEQLELKIKNQIEKYVEWITDYIIPTYNKKIIIIPRIIAPKPSDKTISIYNEIKDSLKKNENNKIIIKNIEYISFIEKNNEIVFEEVVNDQ